MTTWVLKLDEVQDDPNLALALEALAEWQPTTLEASFSEAERRLAGDDLRTYELFAHTPRPLIDAWLVSREVLRLTSSGDVVIVSDVNGLGGMIALIEAAKPIDVRRHIWTVAGSGSWLAARASVGTTDHTALPEAAAMDWELVQYRASAEVLITSDFAADILRDEGVTARPAVPEASALPSRAGIRPESVWVPGPVSRANQSGEVLRGLSSTAVSVTVSSTDAIDAIWTGTTWDTLGGVRGILGDRLERSSGPPEDVDMVIVGHPLMPPSPDVAELRDAGTAIVAPERSVAAAMWPEILTWASSDDVAAAVGGTGRHAATAPPPWPGPSDPLPVGRERATAISVGVPVFGEPEHLTECVESILAQTIQPHEVMLLDDGSMSQALDAVLDDLVVLGEGLVRVLRQPNRGVCVARNHMMGEAQGDAFVFVDQDDVLRPEFLARTREAMNSDPGLAAVAVWTEFFGEYNAIEAKPPFDRRVGLRENPIVSTAALIDVAVRDRGVRFPPDLAFLFCEDWHVWSQIVAAGGRMGLVPEPLIRHRVHHASGGFLRTDLAHRIGRARATEPLTRRR